MGPFLFVHGSPRNPLSEYIFPEDIYNHRKMERLFQLVERYCFQGHTHVPGIFTESFQFFAPEEIDNEYTLGDGKVMVNVGSVGQPRDGDNRACYVILDDGLGDDAEGAGDGRLDAGPFPPDHLPPLDLRLREDDPEDLRDPRARTVPGRPAPTRTLVLHRAANVCATGHPGHRPSAARTSERPCRHETVPPLCRSVFPMFAACRLLRAPLYMSNEKRFPLRGLARSPQMLGSRTC